LVFFHLNVYIVGSRCVRGGGVLTHPLVGWTGRTNWSQI